MSCFVVIVYINQFSIRTSNYYNALKSILKEREGATVKVLVIHNIGSGHGAGAIYDFIRSYAEDGDTITLRTFNGHTPFATLLEDARDYDFVVASGGDGTIAAVTYELRYSDIPILPFPSGTANLLAMNLSSPNEPHALCKVADQGQTMYFDLGEIETPEASIGFTIMAGCGYDEIIMRLLRSISRYSVRLPISMRPSPTPLPRIHSSCSISMDSESRATASLLYSRTSRAFNST